MIRTGIKLTVIGFFFLFLPSCYAAPENSESEITNVNKVTNLLKDLKNQDLFEELENYQKNALIAIIKPGFNPFLTDQNTHELNQVQNLKDIKAEELEERGREEYKKNEVMQNLYVDVEDKKKTYKKIFDNLSEVLLGNLTQSLKDAGIECNFEDEEGEVVEKQEEYSIDTKNEEVEKEIVFTKTICEELKNRYKCQNVLSMRCADIQWKPWEDKEINFSINELFSTEKNLFSIEDRGEEGFEYKLISNPSNIEQMREILVTKHPGSTVSNISTEIEINESSSGNRVPLNDLRYLGKLLDEKHYGCDSYVVKYKYREGTCDKWIEEWNETCIIE